MIDLVAFAVSHADGEGLEWSGVQQVADTLFHHLNLSKENVLASAGLDGRMVESPDRASS